MVKILQDDRVGSLIRIAVLKALGSICYVREGIRELAETKGLEAIVKILGNVMVEEEEHREAVGVIAQLTSPWIEANLCKEKIGKHLVGIIHSLKGMLVNTQQIFA